MKWLLTFVCFLTLAIPASFLLTNHEEALAQSAGAAARCTDPITGQDIVCPANNGAGTCTDPITNQPVACPGRTTGDRPSAGGSVSIGNPLKADSITAFFIDIIEVVLVFATPIIVFFIILAGFKYVVARGNPEKIKEANQALLYAVIGGVLILGAFVILRVIQGTIDAITI